MKLPLTAIPLSAGSGIRVLRNSTVARRTAATRASYLLAQYSVAQTRQLRERLALSYDAATLGTMKIFRDIRAVDSPLALARPLEPLGLRFEVLDINATIATEPALADISGSIAGALRFPADETGDAHDFCETPVARYQEVGGKS